MAKYKDRRWRQHYTSALPGKYIDYVVRTPGGVVEVDITAYDAQEWTVLWYTCNGYTHCRTFDCHFTERGTRRKAREFVNELQR